MFLMRGWRSGHWQIIRDLLAAFMGLWYGALIAVILGIALALYRPWPNARRWGATAIATILAASGAAVISQAGATFNETQISALVLASVLLLVRELDSNSTSPRAPILLLAGGLLGAAVGLKFTCAIYAPAAALASMATLPIKRWPTWALLLVAGGMGGIALGGGWWAYKLYETYGNPVFPFFNAVFRSPWYPPANFFDRRFLPHDTAQALFYPFFWLSNQPKLVTEVPFRDGRVAVAFALGLAVCGIVALRACSRAAWNGRNIGTIISANRPQIFMLLFAALSYLFWLCTTSILRYGIPVEVSAGLIIPLLGSLRVDPGRSLARSLGLCVILTCILIALLVSTRYPQWGRRPYDKPIMSADMSWLRPHALVVFVGAPIAYTAPFASARLAPEFIGLTDVVFEARAAIVSPTKSSEGFAGIVDRSSWSGARWTDGGFLHCRIWRCVSWIKPVILSMAASNGKTGPS